MRDLDLRVVNQFLAISAAGSFRGAAEALHMSQPPLSVAMKQLEEKLGFSLFTRSNTGIRMTEAGAAFACEAQRILEQADRAISVASAVAEGRAGALRIAFNSTAMMAFLPAAIRAFRKAFPDVTVTLTEAISSETARLVGNGQVDLGFLVSPMELMPNVGSEPIYDDIFLAALPTGHRLTAKPQVSLRDLADDPMVGFTNEKAPVFRRLINLACYEQGFEPNIVQTGSHIHTLLYLVAGGVGVALLPSVISKFAYDGVVFKPLSPRSALLSIRMDAIYPSGNASPTVAGFMSILKAKMPSSGRSTDA
ncbi:LysR family transcriptional regulator [Pigmentiphaga soli]